MTATLTTIPLARLRESPANPRQHFAPDALAELAASLKASGQLEPILVRPIAGNGTPAYEIAAGHRRFRAAKLAGLPGLEARVRDLDDKTFFEILTISNLQRDDLHPLEEAAGYRTLMERAGYDVPTIAARVGRSVKYVYDRVKLLSLVPEAKKLFLAGEFEAGHAIILARLAPADQRRAIDKDTEERWGKPGGLFQSEVVDPDPDAPTQEQLKLEDAVKPISVREFQTWVNDHVRLTPAAVDPFLFPDTAQLLTQAQEEELKVVHITHDYRVSDAARDEKQRTYGEQSWKRADGTQKSKPCPHSVVGVVVAGPGRGDAFRVCVRKDKCTVHWAAEQRELARRRTAQGSRDDDYAQERQRREAEYARREAERARWRKATPQLQEALVAKVKALPVGAIGDVVLNEYAGVAKAKAVLGAGRTAEDLLRRLAFVALAESLTHWDAAQEAPKALGRVGIDAKKIVDRVSPPTKTKPPEKKGTRGK